MPSGKPSVEVVVIGGGVIGLSVAVAAARQGLSVQVIDAGLRGAASRVAAGLLAPSLGELPPAAAREFRLAAAGYGAFAASLARPGAPSVGKGILEIGLSPDGELALNRQMAPSSVRMSAREVAAAQPDLAPVKSGVLHPTDGWIEPGSLLDALTACLPAGGLHRAQAVGIERNGGLIGVRLESGEIIHAQHVVVASGSWSPLLTGLSAKLPISPARGETLVLETTHSLSVAIASEDGYLAPRKGAIVVGATFDFVGFDASPTERGRSTLEQLAARLIPGPFSKATARTMWAGLRPMTPDRLPIIDFDPANPRIILACGHGKNGLLLAGRTAEIVVEMLAGNRQDRDYPFRLDRFDRS